MASKYDGIKNLINHPKNHHFLSEPLLVPNVNKTDSNRLGMFCSELNQTVVKNEGEAPLVCTNFEPQVGEYTIDGYKKLDEDCIILEKIKKNKLNYVLIVENTKTGKIFMVKRKEVCWLTEHYGFKYNNDVIDNKEKGDTIKKDEIIYRSNTYDNLGNLKYGRNLNTCYMNFKNLTLEDPMVLSRTAAKALGYSDVYKIRITVNTNDLLINLYGDENDYKAFPNIGESINDLGILASRRRIDYNKLLSNLKDNKLREVGIDDSVFYSTGKVVDIDIFCNQTEEELAYQEYNNQVHDLYMEDKTFRTKLVKCIDYLKKQGKSDMIDSELVTIYNKSKIILENKNRSDKEKNVWTLEGNEFKGFILDFTIINVKELHVGDKLANRYGGKGIVSAILPDEAMPRVESGPFKGEICHVIMNSLGIFNRLIPSALYEIEINFASKHVRYFMSQEDTIEGKEYQLFKYLDMINSTQSEWTREFYESLTDECKAEFLRQIEEVRLPIIQPPFFDNITLDGLSEIYDEYPEMQEYKFEGIKNPMMMGEAFIITLKHDPKGKMSIRSTGFNNMSGLPAKSKAYKDHNLPYSTTPIRFGEMEVMNGLLTKDDTVHKLLYSYATDSSMREKLLETIIENPFEPNIDFSKMEKPKTVKIARAFFKCLGLEIYDGDNEDEIEE